MRRSRSRSALPIVALVAVVGLLLGVNPAEAKPERGSRSTPSAPGWAPADQATITPGSELRTDGAQCTANFIFTDASAVYIGYAAHCAATGSATETNGCETESLPLGTPVEIEGAERPGTLAYSSWLTMQQVGERGTNACNYNDFALVRIDPNDVEKVNPSIPHWGGPKALELDGTAEGERVHSYGNSSLRLGIRALSPKTGTSLGTTGGGWTHSTYTVSPGIPGDSGSALLDAEGRAVGVLSTLAIAPLTGSNNYSDLAKALNYMQVKARLNAQLAHGTEPFDGSKLPVGIG